jgi:hypothetical protein
MTVVGLWSDGRALVWEDGAGEGDPALLVLLDPAAEMIRIAWPMPECSARWSRLIAPVVVHAQLRAPSDVLDHAHNGSLNVERSPR